MSLPNKLFFAAALLALAPGDGACQPAAVEAPPVALSLADAVQRALDKNDRLLDSRDSVEQADLSVRLARSAFRPKVVPNILGSFGQTDVSNQTYRLDLSQRFVTGTELRATAASSTS